MIPKIAHFHWSQRGPEMSWLRWASIRSFRKFHPDWEIRLHQTPPFIASRGLTYAQEADWTWWSVLASDGGWQVATDIIFERRIPDEWMDCDLNACLNGCESIFQFAALGASEKNRYMSEVAHRCHSVSARSDLDPQDLGVLLLRDVPLRLAGKFFDQPMSAFCSIDHDNICKFWQKVEHEPNGEIGLHWYGGGAESRELEWQAGPDSGYRITNLARSVVGR